MLSPCDTDVIAVPDLHKGTILRASLDSDEPCDAVTMKIYSWRPHYEQPAEVAERHDMNHVCPSVQASADLADAEYDVEISRADTSSAETLTYTLLLEALQPDAGAAPGSGGGEP
jgi:hypothetical protein